MLLFIILTNILLLTSLIAILSQSLTKVGQPATLLYRQLAVRKRLRLLATFSYCH